MVVRYELGGKVHSRYLGSVFLGRQRAEDLLSAFYEGTKELNLENLIQVSMDGPNTNKKILRLLVESREKNSSPPLVDIGTCTLHSVSGAFKMADEKSISVGKFLGNAYHVFKDSPARRAMLLEANEVESCKFPKKFCPTRWGLLHDTFLACWNL